MPTQFTEEEKQEIIKSAPKATFLVVDREGEAILDADSRSFGDEVCGEGELTVGYLREDLVMDLVMGLSQHLPEDVLTKVEITLQEAMAEEKDEEVPLAVPVPDSTTVL